MYYYAQINNNKVFAVSSLSGEVNKPDLIPITQQDRRLINAIYTNGTFEGYYVTLEVDKTTIVADGVDEATITANIYNYLDQFQSTSSQNVTFNVDGTEQVVQATDGVATTFSSSVPGEYKITAEVDGYKIASIKVVAE